MKTNDARTLVGRTIQKVDWRYFDDGCGGKASDPVFILDNGTEVQFGAQETEVGEYGVYVLTFRKGEKK